MLMIDPSTCPIIVAGDKTLLQELLHPTQHNLQLGYSLARATVQTGQQSLPHRLQASEVYYILSGTGLMHIGDEKSSIVAGQTVYIPPGETQYITNSGDQDLVFLCIVCPAWQAEDEEVD